jgi:KTSC domain
MVEWREFRPEQSGTVRKVGYDAKESQLFIEFASGGVYRYDGVPKTVANGLLNASSKGAYVAANIIKRNYTCTCLYRAPKKDPTHVSAIAEKIKRSRKPTSV